MGISEKIHKSVLHITRTIGGFNWEYLGDIDTPLGNYEDLWAIYNTLEEIHKTIDNVEETLYYASSHWKFYTNILHCPVNTLSQCIDLLKNSLGVLMKEDIIDGYGKSFNYLMNNMEYSHSFENLFQVFNKSGIDLMLTLEIIGYGVFPGLRMVIPTNELDREILCSVLLFVMVKYSIVKNLKNIHNEN